LFLGIGIELSGEVKQQTVVTLLKATTQRNSESLQFSDGTSPPQACCAEV
jgi:hypothetical protein